MDENKNTRHGKFQHLMLQYCNLFDPDSSATESLKLEYRGVFSTHNNRFGWGFRGVEDVFGKDGHFDTREPTNFHPRLDMDDVDSENSVCMTWSIDPSGTMRHRKTGTKVSTKEGITCPGSRQQKASSWFPVSMSRYDFLILVCFLCPCPEYRFGPCDETVSVLLDISHGDDVLDAVLTETWSPRWMSPDVRGDNGVLVAENMKILLSKCSPRKIVKRKMLVSWAVEICVS